MHHHHHQQGQTGKENYPNSTPANYQSYLLILCLLVRFAEEACSVILSDVFSACHFLLNPAPFQRICRYDVCACEDSEECLCNALSAYAAACAARGVLLSWRSHSLCGNPAWQHIYLTIQEPSREIRILICAKLHTTVQEITNPS